MRVRPSAGDGTVLGMSLLFQASDEPVASRMEYWRHVLAETLVPLDPIDVPDRLVAAEVGAVRVGELLARQPGGARRTARHVRRAAPELYKFDVLVDGGGVVAQDGREARLRRGDLTLVDLARPARWVMSPARIVAVMFPRALLPLRAEEVARLTAVPIPGDQGTGALVSTLARQVAGTLDDYDAAERVRLGTAIVDLLTVALAARLDRGRSVQPDTYQRALLLRVHAFIEQRLGDPRLSPATVAAAHHISVRYLYKLFEQEQASVAGWIRQRRLERCRHDLLDPAQRSRPVSAIAARWGMLNAAHFSRSFRAAYGVPPVEYRQISSHPADGTAALEPPPQATATEPAVS
jgi:AraC-like DNA-binding protein